MNSAGNLPKNWQEKKLGDVCEIVYGKGLPVKELKSSGYPVFGANGIIGFYDRFLFEEPQVLISCRGAASGKINLSPANCYVTNNSLVLDIRNKDKLDRKYLYFALTIAKKTKLVTGTAQPQVTINNAIELDIQFPPLPEQHAIVAKIEELLSDLENGKQQLQTAQ
jgi:type I restriction enzyme, S subunit